MSEDFFGDLGQPILLLLVCLGVERPETSNRKTGNVWLSRIDSIRKIPNAVLSRIAALPCPGPNPVAALDRHVTSTCLPVVFWILEPELLMALKKTRGLLVAEVAVVPGVVALGFRR